MKRQLLTLLIVALLPLSLIAQDGYSFTLMHNGGYSFSVAAVPNYDSGSYTPKTESYGFALVVPDGVTITVDNLLPTGTTIINSGGQPQLIEGTSVSTLDPTMADKDLFLITTQTNAGDLPSHVINEQLPLVTFTVNGTPITGDLTFLDNGSTLANALAPGLDSFIQVDVTDDATVNFINGYLGQTAMTTFAFDTLGSIEFEELGIELYPNPVNEYLNIKGNSNSIQKINIFSINGQHIKQINKDFNIINLKALEASIYFVSIETTKGIQTLKIIKK